METLLLFAGIFGYFLIGAFVTGILKTIKNMKWEDGDDCVIMIFSLVAWPLVLPISLMVGALHVGIYFVKWCREKNR